MTAREAPMTLENWAYLAEIIGAVAVVASLIYVGIQIRASNRVNQANARHQISEFVRRGGCLPPNPR